ncbi:CocE/NonD family hydrolase [Halorientalis halophila]|uniref:CocE/NonD family hydrolase n=1 Tax=Halorientalis halophila TaxID=3108499 RepID=UPI00300BA645
MGADRNDDGRGTGTGRATRRRFIGATGAALTALSAGVGTATASFGSGISTTDYTIESWDGTELEATLYTPDANEPQPAVLMTHGWGAFRESPLTVPKAKNHAKNGYNVLTYDSRGFGSSEGTVGLDGPNEIKDAQRMIDWLANRPEVALDGTDDPRVGMDGVSYAGGIQLSAAAADDRIDAVVPRITWNDLQYSLAPNGVIKIGWLSILLGLGGISTSLVGPDTEIDPRLYDWYEEALRTNELPEGILELNEDRSFPFFEGYDTPTFLVQGWDDSLFKPLESVRTYRALQDSGVDSRIAFYEGGHAPEEITVPLDQREYMNGLAADWLDRHVRGEDADVAQSTTYLKQREEFRTEDQFPPADTEPVAYELADASADGDDRIERWSFWYDSQVTYTWRVDETAEWFGTPQIDLSVDVEGPEARLFVNLLYQGEPINGIGEAYRIEGSGVSRPSFEFPTFQRFVSAGDEFGIQIEVSSPYYLDSRESEGVTVRPGESRVHVPQRSAETR